MAERYDLCAVDELAPGTGKAFVAGGRKIACFNVGGQIFAIEDTCPHDGAPLSEGELTGSTIACPWHGAEFDVTCGKVLCSPAVEDVRSYPVAVEGGRVFVSC